MEHDLVYSLRNLFVCGALFTSATLLPEATSALSRVVRRIRSRLTSVRQSLLAAFREKSSSKFWEIDMTKFEP